VKRVSASRTPSPVLIGSRDVGGVGLVVELDALVLGAPDRELLLGDRQGLPCRCVVKPLLEQQELAARARTAVGDDGELRRVDQARVLAAVDEAREVAVVAVGQAGGFLCDRCHRLQRRDCRPRGVEHDVVGAAGEPEHGVVLGAGIA
jgi:hypothetical protein